MDFLGISLALVQEQAVDRQKVTVGAIVGVIVGMKVGTTIGPIVGAIVRETVGETANRSRKQVGDEKSANSTAQESGVTIIAALAAMAPAIAKRVVRLANFQIGTPIVSSRVNLSLTQPLQLQGITSLRAISIDHPLGTAQTIVPDGES